MWQPNSQDDPRMDEPELKLGDIVFLIDNYDEFDRPIVKKTSFIVKRILSSEYEIESPIGNRFFVKPEEVIKRS